MSCCLPLLRLMGCSKTQAVHQEPEAPSANRLVQVLARIEDSIDPHYQWVGGEPKMKQETTDLTRVQLDHRIIIEEAVILAKLKTETFFAAQQLKTFSSPHEFTYLIAPPQLTMKQVEEANDLCRCAVAGHKGIKESTVDRPILAQFEIFLDKKPHLVQLYAVCNGKSGVAAVEFVEEFFPIELGKSLQKFAKDHQEISHTVIYNAITTTFANIDDMFKRHSSSRTSGAGLSGILIIENKIWPMNLGTSQTILSNQSASIQLTEQAHSNNPRYQTSMLRRKADPEQLNHTIPRAIGHRISIGTSCRPKIYEPISIESLSSDHFFVITSAGIANIAHPKMLLEKINQQKKTTLMDIARNVTYSALQSGAQKFCTTMVIQMNSIK